MNTLLQRLVKAYRPLYLRGLLLDGRYRPPATRPTDNPAASASLPGVGKRRLLVTLTGPGGRLLSRRRKSC